jgi:hypothetical protein
VLAGAVAAAAAAIVTAAGSARNGNAGTGITSEGRRIGHSAAAPSSTAASGSRLPR